MDELAKLDAHLDAIRSGKYRPLLRMVIREDPNHITFRMVNAAEEGDAQVEQEPRNESG